MLSKKIYFLYQAFLTEFSYSCQMASLFVHFSELWMTDMPCVSGQKAKDKSNCLTQETSNKEKVSAGLS